MQTIDQLVEQRIKAAQERGELDNLAGEGKPLELDDDSAVPAELRIAYRLLKNSGFLPPELETLKNVRHAESLLHHLEDNEERTRLMQKISVMKMQLSKSGHQLSHLVDETQYREKLLKRVPE
jgi:hypothetical protein